jgi:2-polyprenyl-3-methyl-5-hydroxy-6-metoxy-1,4-benzoquinol methylase
MEYIIEKNKLGYYEVANKPSKESLEKYYANKYYNDDNQKGQYKQNYNEEEIKYINNYSKRIYGVIKDKLKNKVDKKFLDVGCGEGFMLNSFKGFGFDVLGLDYSKVGITNHNKDMLEYFEEGDIYKSIDNLINESKKFDVINLTNVLEHVIDPVYILNLLKKLLTEDGILIIRVPNDFSILHENLEKNKYIDKQFWVAPPDHLSYFNLESLKNISDNCGYQVLFNMSDYPIDFDLLEDHTNYTKQNVGKHSHIKRMRIDNLLCETSIEKTNEYYNKLSELGFGRNITIFLKIK